MMEEAIKQNYKLVQSTRKKVEENRCEMLEKVHAQVNGYYATLRQLETQIITDINNKASSRQGGLALRENNLHQAAKQIKALKTKFSDTVPNIVKANADKRLDRDFLRLHEVLDKWSLKYSLLQVGKDVLHFNQFVHRNIDMVIELPEQAVKGVPVGLFEPLVPPVEAKEIVTWKQRDENVRDIVCHSVGGGSVTILSSSHLRVYKQNGKMFHSTNHDDKVDRVTTFRECSHAVLDPEKDEIRLYYDWPIFLEKVACVIPESGDVGVGISGTQNYLVYSTWKDSRIKCYSVTYNPPKYLWEWVCKGDSPRCLSALETHTQLLLVVANSLNETAEKSATALFAVNRNKTFWQITFDGLDRDAEKFDLRDMCKDGRYFYVLNTEECCVYLVSIDGEVLSKILQNLQTPKSVACNSKTENLVVASTDRSVNVHKLVYKEQ